MMLAWTKGLELVPLEPPVFLLLVHFFRSSFEQTLPLPPLIAGITSTHHHAQYIINNVKYITLVYGPCSINSDIMQIE
jgi:hypothetical protein